MKSNLNLSVLALLLGGYLCYVVRGEAKVSSSGHHARRWVVRIKPELIHSVEDRTRLAMDLGRDYHLHGEPVPALFYWISLAEKGHIKISNEIMDKLRKDDRIMEVRKEVGDIEQDSS